MDAVPVLIGQPSVAVRDLRLADHTLSATLADPRRDTPELVRALAVSGVEILAVGEREASLESIYFDVMGVRPESIGALR